MWKKLYEIWCLANSIHEEINPLNVELNPIYHLLALLGAHLILHVSGVKVKGRLKSENACYHSVQNILPSSLLSEYILWR